MIKIERILCPTDLTSESQESLRYAVALAREYEARLCLCHCVPAFRRQRKEPNFMGLLEEALIPHLGVSDFSHLDWKGNVVEGDDVGLSITDEAAARRCDLIVIRSRRRPNRAASLGSTAETVCRSAPCSVLVTHPNERECVGFSAGDIDLKRVLVAHDFSDRSELALEYGMSFAHKFKSELQLIHVLSKPEANVLELAWMPGNSQSLYHTALGRLQHAIASENNSQRKVKCVVVTGKVYEKVLLYAKEMEVDLICMGADGIDHSALTLFGSNVDRVLRQSPCPVLIARAFKPAAQEEDRRLPHPRMAADRTLC